MNKILPLFSYVFHPILIPLFGTLLYLTYNENYFEDQQKILILAQVSIITILLPIAFYFLLKTYKKVDSIMIASPSQRKLPLMIQIVLIFILIQKSITVDLIPELHFFFWGGLISAATAFLLLHANLKVSLHMIGISAITAFSIGLCFHNRINMIYPITFLISLNGFVANSRIEMKAHSIKELIIGFWIGLLPQLMLWYFWL
ncbi:MAG TPA: hypothetical protein VK476_05895 [Flavobacterium sp.]|nr:hypothetical protein [Flavobacterium sp.]